MTGVAERAGAGAGVTISGDESLHSEAAAIAAASGGGRMSSTPLARLLVHVSGATYCSEGGTDSAAVAASAPSAAKSADGAGT